MNTTDTPHTDHIQIENQVDQSKKTVKVLNGSRERNQTNRQY